MAIPLLTWRYRRHFRRRSSTRRGAGSQTAGHYVARCILADLKGKGMPVLRYRDYCSLARIERKRAVGQMGPLRIGGFATWLIWSRAPPHHRRLRLARGKHGRRLRGRLAGPRHQTPPICPLASSASDVAKIALRHSLSEEGRVLMSSVHESAEEHQICRRGAISDRCFIAPSRKLRTVVFSNADA
jgi:hypothetical protein